MALTQNDKKWISKLLEEKLEDKFAFSLGLSKAHTDEKFTQFEEKFKGIPEKLDKYQNYVETTLAEIKKLREDFNLLTGTQNTQEERIVELENVVLPKSEIAS